MLNDIGDAEEDAWEGSGANLPLRNDHFVLGNKESLQVLPCLPHVPELPGPRVGRHLHDSKGSKRETLDNLSPVIEFETVANPRKYLPSQFQSVWEIEYPP
jgi:hypothetical protein